MKINLIDGFDNLTPQQCFDMAARHILSTRTKSVNRTRSCVYTGSGCAASPFIKDDGSREEADAAGSWLSVAVNTSTHNEGVIEELQHAHDGADVIRFMPSWIDNMTAVALRLGLDSSILDGQDDWHIPISQSDEE